MLKKIMLFSASEAPETMRMQTADIVSQHVSTGCIRSNKSILFPCTAAVTITSTDAGYLEEKKRAKTKQIFFAHTQPHDHHQAAIMLLPLLYTVHPFCPPSAAFFGFMGCAVALIFASCVTRIAQMCFYINFCAKGRLPSPPFS